MKKAKIQKLDENSPNSLKSPDSDYSTFQTNLAEHHPQRWSVMCPKTVHYTEIYGRSRPAPKGHF